MIKVCLQPKPKNLRKAADNIHTTRKIAVKLKRPENRRHQQMCAGFLRRIAKHSIDKKRQTIGNHDFLKIAPEHQL